MTRLFRVVNGRCAGQIVSEDETVECPRCEGRGEIRGSFGGDGYGDRCAGVMDWEADCDVCRGSGVLLGIPDQSWQEPQRLVEVSSHDRRGESVGDPPSTGTPHAPTPPPVR